MPDIKIKQSGKRGTGILLAAIMLAVLYFTRSGGRIGDLHDRHDRQQQSELELQRVLKHSGEDARKIRGTLEQSAKKFLDKLPKPKPDAAEAAIGAELPTDTELEKLIVGKWLNEDAGGIFNQGLRTNRWS
jgi:hypothetical protein